MSDGTTDGRTVGIVVTHGKLAEELVRTVELILGKQEDLHAVPAGELCDEDIVRAVREILGARGGARALVFVDYFGGSGCVNCVRAVERMEGIKILSGVNLPILLSFATKRGTMPYEEMVDHLVRRGRESVKVIDL